MEQRRTRAALILLAAGASARMGENKLLFSLAGKTPIAWCAEAIARCETDFSPVVVAVSAATRAAAAAAFPGALLVQGGSSRAGSVRSALCVLGDAGVVAIHDAARCLVTPEIFDESVRCALREGSGVAAIPARDTLHGPHGPIDRAGVWQAQTPQTFLCGRIRAAYAMNAEATDDAALYGMLGYTPCFFPAGLQNQKLTEPADVPLFAALLAAREGTCA